MAEQRETVCLISQIVYTYIECGDGAGWVSRDELDLYVHPAKLACLLGAERRASWAIKSQRDGLLAAAVSDELCVAPHYLQVIGQIAGDMLGDG